MLRKILAKMAVSAMKDAELVFIGIPLGFGVSIGATLWIRLSTWIAG